MKARRPSVAVSASGASAHFDGTTWPLPGPRLDALEYTMRHGEPTREDVLVGASVIAAYRALVAKTARERSAVVRGLRQAQRLAVK